MTNIFMLGFAIGGITILLGYRIIYHIFWYNFKLKGKKHNLKTIRCKMCNDYFYVFDIETTRNCCNCILLKIANNE